MRRGKPGSFGLSGDRRLIARLIPATEWHPLTNGGAPPDYVPPTWDGPHVGKRLVEALRTLRLLPTSNGPRVFGNAWPSYFHGWEDQLAQQEMEKDLREQLERARNRTRLMPSSIDIARMETAIGWPGRYLLDRPQLIRVVQAVTFGRARYREMEWAAERLELPGRLVRRWHRDGLDLIAAGLRRENARIF